MQELPKSDWVIRQSPDPRFVLISTHANEGYRDYVKLEMSGVPNGLSSLEYLKLLGIVIEQES